jgi:pimeloyl-[acyl-carrier protein] methyl ester esterase
MKLKMEAQRIVLLPGLDGTGRMFEPFLKIIRPPILPLVVRFPRDRPQNYQQLLHHIREEVPWDEPYVLVAESFSSPLALYFAQSQWEDIQAVILCSGFVRNPLSEMQRLIYSMLPKRIMKKSPPLSALRSLMLGGDSPAYLNDLFKSSMEYVLPDVIASRIDLALNTDASTALQECKRPVHYLQASHDNLIGRRGWEQISHLRSDCTCMEIEGPHLLIQSRPLEVLAAIEQFLANLGAPHPEAARLPLAS